MIIQVRRLWGVVQPQVALAGFGPHLQERHARVTLQQRGRVRLPHAQASWVESDVGNELSVLRNPRKHPPSPPSTIAHGVPW